MTRLLYDIEDYLEDAAQAAPLPRVDAPSRPLDQPHGGRDGGPLVQAPRRVLIRKRTGEGKCTVCRVSRR